MAANDSPLSLNLHSLIFISSCYQIDFSSPKTLPQSVLTPVSSLRCLSGFKGATHSDWRLTRLICTGNRPEMLRTIRKRPETNPVLTEMSARNFLSRLVYIKPFVTQYEPILTIILVAGTWYFKLVRRHRNIISQFQTSASRSTRLLGQTNPLDSFALCFDLSIFLVLLTYSTVYVKTLKPNLTSSAVSQVTYSTREKHKHFFSSFLFNARM